jgi:hypothetical protein
VRSASLKLAGAIATFGAHAVVEAARPPYELREILRHAYQFGYRSAPLILTAGVAIGVVLSMHTRASLERFGAEVMIPAALAVALIRETGPLITGLLVAGRVGAGIGAEIGAMKVTEQIDALEANAVDAFKYLAVTRIIALMICPRRHCQVNARGDTRLPCCYVAESVKPRPGAVDRRRGTPARAQDVNWHVWNGTSTAVPQAVALSQEGERETDQASPRAAPGPGRRQPIGPDEDHAGKEQLCRRGRRQARAGSRGRGQEAASDA